MTFFYVPYRPEEAQHIFVGVYPHHVTFPPANENVPVPPKDRPETQEWTVRILNPVVALPETRRLLGEHDVALKVRSSSLRKVVWGRFRGVDRRYGDAARIFLQALASSAVAKVRSLADSGSPLLPEWQGQLETFLAAVNTAIDQLSETPC